MQHATERVERPGESQEALDGKYYHRVSEATQHYAETKAPPSQEPRDHRVQAARATFSQILGHNPKASNDTAMWQLES